MGEYFKWVNPKKKEWIDDEPFSDYGFLYNFATYLGDGYTDAACTLLAGRWKGDPVMYVGDYFTPENDSQIGRLFNGYPYDDIMDNFKNIGGVFKCSEGLLRQPWEEGDDPDGDDVPYSGPFDTEVHHYRYALNRKRGEYVDRDAGPVRHVHFHDGAYSWDRLDPLVPLLTPRNRPSEWEGRWCLDGIEMLDELPVGEYEDAAPGACFDWFCPLFYADDAEMAELTASDEFARELERRGQKLGKDHDDMLFYEDVVVLKNLVAPGRVKPLWKYEQVVVPDGRHGRVVDVFGAGSAYLVEFDAPDGHGSAGVERFEVRDLVPIREG